MCCVNIACGNIFDSTIASTQLITCRNLRIFEGSQILVKDPSDMNAIAQPFKVFDTHVSLSFKTVRNYLQAIIFSGICNKESLE